MRSTRDRSWPPGSRPRGPRIAGEAADDFATSCTGRRAGWSTRARRRGGRGDPPRAPRRVRGARPRPLGWGRSQVRDGVVAVTDRLADVGAVRDGPSRSGRGRRGRRAGLRAAPRRQAQVRPARRPDPRVRGLLSLRCGGPRAGGGPRRTASPPGPPPAGTSRRRPVDQLGQAQPGRPRLHHPPARERVDLVRVVHALDGAEQRRVVGRQLVEPGPAADVGQAVERRDAVGQAGPDLALEEGLALVVRSRSRAGRPAASSRPGSARRPRGGSRRRSSRRSSRGPTGPRRARPPRRSGAAPPGTAPAPPSGRPPGRPRGRRR